MTNDNPLDLGRLRVKLEATLGMTNYGQADRDRDIVKTGALLSIAESLEATKVPEHWEALEGPSGAILGWFDPQVARAIAQALGASQARAEADDETDPDERPLEVGSAVVLTSALTDALDLGDPTLATIGEVLELGESEQAAWARVRWDDDDESEQPGKVWATELTVLDRREGTRVDEAEAEVVESVIDATLETLNREADGEPDLPEAPAASNDGFDIEPDSGAGDPAPEPDETDDDIDADFDTVVDPGPVDGLTALRKGKSTKG